MSSQEMARLQQQIQPQRPRTVLENIKAARDAIAACEAHLKHITGLLNPRSDEGEARSEAGLVKEFYYLEDSTASLRNTLSTVERQFGINPKE